MENLKISSRQIAVACELMKFGFEYYNFTKESFVMQKRFKGEVVTAFIKYDGKINGTDLERFLALSHANKEPVEPISIVPSNNFPDTHYKIYLSPKDEN